MPRPLRIALAVTLVGTLVVCGVVAWSWRPPDDLGLVDGRLRPCPSSPNCVCSQDPDPARRVAPLALEGDPEAAFEALLATLRAHPRVAAVVRDGDYAHATFVTPVLRFVDDVELLLDRGARCAHVRSASRVGYSDLGANAARVEALRAR